MNWASRLKNLVLAVAFAVMAAGASAQWAEVGGSYNSTLYVDMSTIQKSDSVVKMWYLMDFTFKQSAEGLIPFFSSKDLSEYDCKKVRSRTLYFSDHAEKMGAGDVVFTSTTPLEWSPVPPGSVRQTLWNVACGQLP